MAGTNALQKPLTPSAELAAVIGAEPITRGAVMTKIWEYIKANDLQNPENKREIIADEKLKPVFHGEPKVTMFAMSGHLSKHLN